MDTGIYEIKNKVNGKRYIGSTKSFTNRFRRHRNSLRRGDHHSVKLQRAWVKYGETAFEFRKIIICSEKDMQMYEQRTIDAYSSVTNGYNIEPIAGKSTGVKRTQEVCDKLSKIGKAQWQKEGHRERMSNAHKGQVISEYCKQRTSEVHTGKIVSAETRAKMSAAKMGRPVSEETRGKLSKAHTGRKASAETRAKMSAAHRLRRTLSQEEVN